MPRCNKCMNHYDELEGVFVYEDETVVFYCDDCYIAVRPRGTAPAGGETDGGQCKPLGANMQNENYLGVECPKCGRMFKTEVLNVVFHCNSNYIGACPRCGAEVEAHLTQRELDEKPAGLSFIQKLLATFRQ